MMEADLLKEILTELRAIRAAVSAKSSSDRLTREQAATALSISGRSFDRLVKAQKIKRDQDTGPLRFRLSDIEAYKMNSGALIRSRRARNA